MEHINETKKSELKALHTKKRPGLMFQLWGMMMGLVVLTAACMWFVQVFFFEHTYAETALSNSLKQLQPVMSDLTNRDLTEDDHLLPFLSRMIDGTIFLVDDAGDLTDIYSYGHLLTDVQNEPEYGIWKFIRNSDEFSNVKARQIYQNVLKSNHHMINIHIGIPVTYAGENAYLLIENTIRTDAAFTFNRIQLIILTVVLTIAASILAAVGSRYFTKPIFAIKHTVDRLAENDFSARADVNRKDELGELAESVGLLGQALARVDVLRKEVIANVSHELRSPLSVISGYAELVRDIHWKDEEARNEDLDLIIEESNRMSEMVTDILDYSQLQSGYIKLRPESFDFTGLAESETSHCAAAAATYGIRVRFEAPKEPVFIYADPLKLSQILRNLLYNAINHTPEGDVITVSLEPKSDRTVRLSVMNPGTPISEEDKKIIWERYQRSQHQSGRRMGTGIGLSIVSTILNAHGMKYGVDSDEKGTTFWFEVTESGSNSLFNAAGV